MKYIIIQKHNPLSALYLYSCIDCIRPLQPCCVDRCCIITRVILKRRNVLLHLIGACSFTSGCCCVVGHSISVVCVCLVLLLGVSCNVRVVLLLTIVSMFVLFKCCGLEPNGTDF